MKNMDSILEVYSEVVIGDGPQINIGFIGKGNVWINNTYTSYVTKLARTIISRAICETSPGQLSVIGYDSDLSGIFSPFSSLSSGDSKILEIFSNEKDFQSYIDFLWQHIQSVQNVIQGRAESLYEFREHVNRPIESYILVVISVDMGMISNELRSKLAILMRRGPACGVSFLIISTTFITVQSLSGKDIELSIEAIAPNISVLETSKNHIRDESGKTVDYTADTPEYIIQMCENFSSRLINAKLPFVSFSEIHNMNSDWSCNSTNGVSFTIGKYGINNMNIVIGDEINQRHNALITGAVGQGKSNLISVIIHSLCLNYSPKELRLYLLDFKEGVTFKAFSNIGQDEYLPHANALGLDSDVSFGIAVLKSLYSEYERRMKLLKEKNVKSLRELRSSDPSIEMPRIVVVIDEFQMMFGDDMQVAQDVSELLEKSVRLFRAAGIHFILASQTLSGNLALAQKKDSIFSQVPIRIALKNSITESQQTLSLNNTAAAFLKPREAIVNLDYGEVSQNKKTIIAFADEKVLLPLRQKWWQKANTYTKEPYVFESEKRIKINDSLSEVTALLNEKPYFAAIVGKKISVDNEYVELPFIDEPGRNIAIIGTPDNDCNQAIGIMQSIAISLALRESNVNARFMFCDFEKRGVVFEERYPEFAGKMADLGHALESVYQDQFENIINDLTTKDRSEHPIFLFATALDRWEYEKDPYGQGSALKTLVESGPAKNIFFIGWWIKSSSYVSQTSGYGNSDAFNSKIFLRIDERAVQSLTSPFVKWSAQMNRALISDPVEFSEEFAFIPFSPINDEKN